MFMVVWAGRLVYIRGEASNAQRVSNVYSRIFSFIIGHFPLLMMQVI